MGSWGRPHHAASVVFGPFRSWGLADVWLRQMLQTCCFWNGFCEAFKHQNTHYLQHPQVVEGLNEQEIQWDLRKCVRLGNDVLVRAITKAGERSVDVYLPWPQTLAPWNNSQAWHVLKTWGRRVPGLISGIPRWMLQLPWDDFVPVSVWWADKRHRFLDVAGGTIGWWQIAPPQDQSFSGAELKKCCAVMLRPPHRWQISMILSQVPVYVRSGAILAKKMRQTRGELPKLPWPHVCCTCLEAGGGGEVLWPWLLTHTPLSFMEMNQPKVQSSRFRFFQKDRSWHQTLAI